jgi:predicted transcriptional regulator
VYVSIFWEKESQATLHRVEILSDQTKKKGINSHRGRLDVIADILEASQGEVKKTYLMYRCNMSFRQLKYYLDFLLTKELLFKVANDCDNDPSLFKITDKGKEFLKTYNGLKFLIQ